MNIDFVPFAHALVARKDLPIETWVATWAASIVLIVSFFALIAGWRTPRFQDDRWRPLPGGLRFALSRPAQALYGAIGVGLLGVAIYSGLRGTDAPDRNFALTFLFVTVWLGFPVASLFLGDIFRAFNPWRAVGRLVGRMFGRAVGQEPAHLRYPERLGRWPAAVGLVAFVWLEVVYGASGGVAVGVIPHDAAVAAIVYSVYTFAMMALFGVETWVTRGETFSVYFGMFATLGPFEVRDGAVGIRRFFSGATRWATMPGSIALVVASVGTTSFDGGQEGAFKNMIQGLFDRLTDLGIGLSNALRGADTIFLVFVLAGIALVYFLGVLGMRTVRNARPLRELMSGFSHTLIPIALAYLVAHYFSLFVFQEQAQFTYLLSDPLGTGSTDLFATAASGIDYSVLNGKIIEYTQIGALLAGHVIGLTLAHDRAIAWWDDYRQATQSQYWMLAVMIGLTSFGIYLLTFTNG